MRINISLVTIALFAHVPSQLVIAQVSDPIPDPITKRGLTVRIDDGVRLPRTLGQLHASQDVNPAGWARVSFVRDAPDGRRFVNDQRGYLYMLEEGAAPALYADFAAAFPRAVYNRLESGFVGFGLI